MSFMKSTPDLIKILKKKMSDYQRERDVSISAGAGSGGQNLITFRDLIANTKALIGSPDANCIPFLGDNPFLYSLTLTFYCSMLRLYKGGQTKISCQSPDAAFIKKAKYIV